MQSSKYARQVATILAEMEQEQERDDKQPDQDEQAPEKVVYIYPLEGGGVVFTETPIEDEEPQPSIVECREPETDQRPIQRKGPPHFLHFLLLLLLFVGLDSGDTMLTALFTPTATITIIPQQQSLTTTAIFPIGTSPGDVQGRVVPALTLSQSQTVQATGRGHQDARSASGTLTFYNGSFAAQTIDAGAVYTGADGVQVVTEQTITIPAANPPYVGEATVSASAIHAGAGGNIQAGDISITTATLQVRNSQFSWGQDARDFTYVTRGDIQQANSALTPMLLQSEQGALSAQLHEGETLAPPTCTPRVFSNHKSGDEAASVAVTVSETCKAAAYSQQSLQQAALKLVRVRLTHLNTNYQLIGAIQITIRATMLDNGSATLAALLHGVWVYQINEEKIKSLVAGKPRLQAIRLLSTMPGIERLSIAGIADNQPLPEDQSHIHVLILVTGF
jgi:hypothetical protein